MVLPNSWSAALVAAMLVLIATPTSASETVSEDYYGALGVSSGSGYAYGIIINPANDYAPVPGLGSVPAIGGAHLYAKSAYNAVVVSASDDLFGVNAATAACFWAPSGDRTCDPKEDIPSEVKCGPHVLKGKTSWASSQATVWTFAIHVAEDLDFCGAAIGSVTGIFYDV